MTVQHTILVHGTQTALIMAYDATHYTVECWTEAYPDAKVAYDTTTDTEAERWAKAVIAYPNEKE